MRFYRRRHNVPELNTTSTADISFMLLIFFLVTTNMDVDKGLSRQLPPAEKQEQQSFVQKGTLMTLKITADNHLLVDDRPLPMGQVRDRVEAFVRRLGNRHLIKVEVDAQASYNTYFQLQNELVAAYTAMRNATALRMFKHPYNDLSQEQRDQVKEACPQRIAEQYAATPERQSTAQQEGGMP